MRFRTERGLQADIGIVVNVNPQENAMETTNRIRTILASLLVMLVAAALIGATVWTPARDMAGAKPKVKSAEAPMVGKFTGEFEQGAPVYRLPSIAVVTTRSAELAKMAQEAQIARK